MFRFLSSSVSHLVPSQPGPPRLPSASCLALSAQPSTPSDLLPVPSTVPQSNTESNPRLFSAVSVRPPPSSGVLNSDHDRNGALTIIDPKQMPEVTHLLGSMISLIVSQGQSIKASEQKDLDFNATINQKLNLLEGRVYTLRGVVNNLPQKSRYTDRLQHVDTRLRAVEDDVRDFSRTSPSRRIRDSARVRQLERKTSKMSRGQESRIERVVTPPTSLATVKHASGQYRMGKDYNVLSPRLDMFDPTIELSMTPADVPANNEVDDIELSVHKDVEMSLSLVDRAIQAEKEKLGGASVLAEGENTVDFHVRKRVVKKRKRDTFTLDLGFLDEVSIDGNAVIQNNDPYEAYMNASQCSSGIEDLPESLPSRASSMSIVLDGPTSRDKGKGKGKGNGKARGNGWNPFPSQMMRQQSVSISPSISSADSEESHLTAVRRGASLVEDKLLAPGEPSESGKDGKKGKKGKGKRRNRGPVWPAFGPNTIKTRMEEVICDNCSGRVHYACAGPLGGKDMNKEPWSCPNCIWILTHTDDDEEIDIPRAQQERCLREDCIYRSARKVVRKNNDDNEFFMERIVGRKRLRWEANGKATYVYLVKWYDWALHDSTWEPRCNIPNIGRQEAFFLQEARRQGVQIDPRNKVVLLPEMEMWMDHKGQYRLDVLEGMGLDKRWWWEA
ncbi:hypothetical protein IAT40_006943 [Kwoniella sp. CBS 6097]